MATKEQIRARKLWADELESGKHKQTRNVLKSKDNGFCCLGVACLVYNRETNSSVKMLLKGKLSTYDNLNQVRDWYGLNSDSGEFKTANGSSSSLIGLNDTKKYTFKEIAKVIRSKPEGLFK